MDVSLTPELARRVQEKVDAGLYASASDLVREALQRLFESEEIGASRLAQLNADIQHGLDQLDRGDGLDGDDSRRRAMARFAPTGS
jgi:antitoxin ParD1/3/4